MTPQSTSWSTPDTSRTTPHPVFREPGSMPMMVTDCDMRKRREEISVLRMEARLGGGAPNTLPGERLLEHSALKGTEGRW